MRIVSRLIPSIFIIIFGLFAFARPTNALVGNPNAVGMELPDGKNAGPNVIDRYGYKGVVAVINELGYAPVNPIPSKSSTPTVLRLWVNSGVTHATAVNYANQLKGLAASEFPNLGVIVFGNELNNLDGEWKNTSVTLEKAAQDYADLYIAFAQALGDGFTLAPAPPDLYNGVYDPVRWVKAFDAQLRARGGCQYVDTLVANVFKDVTPRVPFSDLESYKYLEQNICNGNKKVTHFEGWGARPAASLKDQIAFLDDTPLPAGVATATSLIPPHCEEEAVTNATTGWWYYVPGPDGRGTVYKADGSKVDPETCTDTGEKFEIRDIPCSGTMDPEFHSLRPYPASPCNRELQDKALLCGNDLLIKEEYEFFPGAAPGDPTTGAPIRCEPLNGGGERCFYKVKGQVNIATNFNNAELPIMGNTQKVPNSTQQSTSLSFAQRMNEYVSWYLNGVTHRAEEIPTKQGDDLSIYNIVNLSGPLRKLLPQIVQNLVYRQKQTNDIGALRHNQVVACMKGSEPVACYRGLDDSKVRLSDWRQLPPIYSYVPYSSTEDRVGRVFTGTQGVQPVSGTGVGIQTAVFTPTTPPRFGEPLYFAHMQEDAELAEILQRTFMTKSETLKEPKGWSGQAQPNEYLSGPSGCVIVDTRTNPGDDLYAEYDRGGAGSPESIQGVVDYQTAEFSCDFPPPKISSSCINNCVFNGETVDVCATKPECVEPTPSCKKDAFIAMDMQTETPKADEIWERLVVGSAGIFKRMFPKIGPGTPVEEIKDLPGKTSASYTAASAGQVPNRINTSALAGEISVQKDAGAAELYFPHLGGIYDYFLKNMQKALRPLGFSDTKFGSVPPTQSGEDSTEPGSCTPRTCKSTWSGNTIGSWPTPIQTAFREASSKWGIPVCVLTGIASVEGSKMKLLSNAEAVFLTQTWGPDGVQQLQARKREDGTSLFSYVNCSPNSFTATGPMQMKTSIFANHGGASGSSNPSVCNARDAIHAVAKFLTTERLPVYGYAAGSAWSDPKKFCAAGQTYYGSCLLDTPTCNNLGANYCDFVRAHCGIDLPNGTKTCGELMKSNTGYKGDVCYLPQ